ncbi:MULTISPECIES: hypothetical protein [unclassified Sphingomonas]|uniref:hypothetical protein n=1 Tax=Sphingomonas TaxID=13687 RepID=UPI00095D0D02|nr:MULTISPECIES: hypothetical protein [unclassified Sphingomonas]MBN8810787.1 hypothetical protein [Sphingomonas sp.]OJY49317.1 MAG: hypothetical protein BGP17_11925 [Sphingomonas sp. 67-41]
MRAMIAMTMLALAGCTQSTSTSGPAPEVRGGGLSPVPAFNGGGEGWSIDITSTGGGAHDASLVWASGSQRSDFKLFYRGQPADAPSTLIVLSGEMRAGGALRPVIVEIKREPCKDDAGASFLHSVSVTAEGVVPGTSQMRGCGHLAMR